MFMSNSQQQSNRICFSEGQIEEMDLRFFRDPAMGVEFCAACVTGKHGTGVGGTREANWRDDKELVEDVLRLAQGMRFKCAFHKLPFSGAKICVKTVPGADPKRVYRAVGELVARFQGKLVTAEDVGTDPRKMDIMHEVAAPYVVGRSREMGGAGDPSGFTALGVYHGLKSVCRVVLNRNGTLKDTRILVKGIGHVGAALLPLLLEEEARVVIADLDPKKVAPFAGHPLVEIAGQHRIHELEGDIFCPCAMGGEINGLTKYRVRAIAGAANNQLAYDAVDRELIQQGITWVPDWVINGGGLMSVVAEYLGEERDWVTKRATEIGARVEDLLVEAQSLRRSPLAVAYEVCDRNLQAFAHSAKAS
jgi:leucine dehydrogenase